MSKKSSTFAAQIESSAMTAIYLSIYLSIYLRAQVTSNVPIP